MAQPIPQAEQMYLVRIAVVYIPATSTVDNPSYRESSRYTVYLGAGDLRTLGALKAAIRAKVGAGYVRSQFF